MRTRKDLRKFATAEYTPNDDWGQVEFPGDVNENRFDRFLGHGWINDDGSLTKTGKQIFLHTQEYSDPHEAIGDMRAPEFVNQSEQYDPSRDIEEQTYANLRVRSSSDDPNIPEGKENYQEREVRAGLSDVELVGWELAHGNHVLLTGETGTGKTSLPEHLAQKCNIPVRDTNFSGETQISRLMGHYTVQEENGASQMEWVDGILTDAVRNGKWFIANEVNMADGDITSLLHSVCRDDQPNLTIPESGEVVEVHPDFRLIGTMNPRYAGTQPLNIAFRDRLSEFTIDYLDSSTERTVVRQQSDLDDVSEIEDIVKICRNLRNDYMKGEITVPITPRSMIRIADHVAAGHMDVDTATKQVIVPKAEERNQSAIEKTIGSVL